MTYDPASFTQTREIGFFERIGASLLGIPLGIILIFFPMSLLWWNEHRNVEAQQAIDLALEQVVSVPAGPVAARNDGKLVHVIGPTSASALTDPAFGLTLPALVVAQRKVEMYQWRERQSQQTATNWGGSQTVTTTFSYDKVWSADWADSRAFRMPQGHENPPMPARSALLTADDAKLGAFRLGPETLGALTQSGLGPSTVGGAPPGFLEVRPAQAPAGFIFDQGGVLYRGKSPSAPAIGDVRVGYSGLPAGKALTVVARQNGDGFTDYPVTRGYTLQLAAVGEHSATALLADKAGQEATLTWIVRLIGVVVMGIGFMVLLGPLATLVSVVPFLGTLAEGLTADVAFILAAILGAITIAAAWLFVHPLISLGLILATLMVGGAYIYIRRG